MSTGKFTKKLISVENIKEERSEQLVRKALLQSRPGSTALITLIEKKWFRETEIAIGRLLSMGLKDTRSCTEYAKSSYSEKCVNCSRRLPAHEEEEATYQNALQQGESRRQIARDEKKFGWNPLHFGVLGGAPSSTIRALLKLCPEWASQPEPVFGRFPLHSAARVRYVDVVLAAVVVVAVDQILISQAGPRTPWDHAAIVRDQFPDAAQIRDKQGKTPSDWAVVRGGRKAGGGSEWRWKNQYMT